MYAIKELKEEMKSEMREEMRRLQDRMTEACEQRIEAPFDVREVSYNLSEQTPSFPSLQVYDQKFTQKIDEMRTQIGTQIRSLEVRIRVTFSNLP